MKVALIRPPIRESAKRGVGYYADRLFNSLSQLPNLQVFWKDFSLNLNDQTVDLFHIPFFEPYFLRLPVLANKKVVLTIHDVTRLVFPDWFPPGFRGSIEWAIQKNLIKNVTHVITDSYVSQKDIQSKLSIPKEKLTVVHLAADELFRKSYSKSQIDAIAKKYKLPEKFILYVGGANWNKNVLALSRAAKNLDLPLVLVGNSWVDPGPMHLESEQLHAIIDSEKTGSKVIRLGQPETSDLAMIYRSATVYVQPSRYEGFGLPPLEAITSGCITVATKGGSLPEICEDAVIYCDGFESENIAAGIKKALSLSVKEKSELQKKMLAQSKKFSWEKTAKQTYEVYQKILP